MLKRNRRLRIESLEDRRMLAKADVVFIVDESASGGNIQARNWIRALVTGDIDGNGSTSGPNDTLSLAQRLAGGGIDQVRYGLVGFGEVDTKGTPSENSDDVWRFAHSQLFESGNPSSFFGDPSELTTGQLNTAFNNLAQNGGDEDGWDAIEHAIAEYEFEPGTVPIFVLVQNDEGRIGRNFFEPEAANESLTRYGTLAALKSKNVILNTLTVGNVSGIDFETFFATDWSPVFDLSDYEVTNNDFANIRILGVESPSSDNGQHDYHAVNTSSGQPPQSLPATEANTLQISYNGTNTGAGGMVGSEKSILISKGITGGLGPTTSGYRAKSIPYEFVDLAAPGSGATTVTSYTSGSESSGFVQLTPGLSFPFFGSNRTNFYVSTHGLITFDSDVTSTANEDWSRFTPSSNQPSLAVLWDNIAPVGFGGGDGDILWRFDNVSGTINDRLIIQWNNVVLSEDSNNIDPLTFQAILNGDGRIQFNYKDLDSFRHFDENDTTIDDMGGLDATVGIWGGAVDEMVLPAGKYVPGPHSFFGNNETFFSVAYSEGTADTNDSYIRMAWDTGGAAWDIGVVDEFFGSGGIGSDEARALANAFATSLANQILRADDSRETFQEGEVVVAINYGGDVLSAPEGSFAADTGDTVGTRLTTNESIDRSSNSIFEGSTGNKVHEVFKSARAGDTDPFGAENEDIEISFATLANGAYIVEFFFAEIDPAVVGDFFRRTFDVIVEGNTLLSDYNIYADRARTVSFSNIELDSAALGGVGDSSPNAAGIVKRFAVDVSDADGVAGLQILLRAQGSDALINGIRILRAAAPRVENIVIKGSSWEEGVDYSYSDVVAAGRQLRPIYLEGANTIEVHFDGPVTLPATQQAKSDALQIFGFGNAEIAATVTFQSYNPVSNVATWTLSAPLGIDKYRLVLDNVTGSGGQLLDGDWEELANQTNNRLVLDNFSDDLGQRFLTGNGTAGGVFQFLFSVLPGDYNQDGAITTIDDDSGVVRDGTGDGQITSADTNLATNNVDDQLPLRVKGGDYWDDDYIDEGTLAPNFGMYDFSVWKTNFGNTVTPHTVADGNGSGLIWTEDFVTWRNRVGEISAWNAESIEDSQEVASASGINAPKVANVIISGSTSTHNPHSFDDWDTGGNQLQRVQVGGADTISIEFTEDVNVLPTFLRLVGLTTGNVPTVAAFNYDSATKTATWRFENWALADLFVIQLDDAITDTEGNKLDGEWVNPRILYTSNSAVSEFPSGDGDPGGDFVFVMMISPADANGDSTIDWTDHAYMDWAWMWGLTNLWQSDGDATGDGVVTSADYDIFYATFGIDLDTISILADLDGDFDVDVEDAETLIANLGLTNADWEDGDLNDDGTVDQDDLDLLFAMYGIDLEVAG